MKLGLKLNTKDLGIKGWSIYFDRQHNNYIVVKTSFFGLIKKPVARFRNTDAARKLIIFMSNPLYVYITVGRTDIKRQWLLDALKTIADNIYDINYYCLRSRP